VYLIYMNISLDTCSNFAIINWYQLIRPIWEWMGAGVSSGLQNRFEALVAS